MNASELQARARHEADELGSESRGREAKLWREERWGAVVLLAGWPTTTLTVHEHVYPQTMETVGFHFSAQWGPRWGRGVGPAQ
jgi:hypothetical protein